MEEQVELRKEKFPESPNFLERLVNALYGLSIVESNLEDEEASESHRQEALEIAREIGHDEWIKTLEG